MQNNLNVTDFEYHLEEIFSLQDKQVHNNLKLELINFEIEMNRLARIVSEIESLLIGDKNVR